MSRNPCRNRSVGTGTRGDDATTSDGRRQILSSSSTGVARLSSSAQMEGALSTREKVAEQSLEGKKGRHSKRVGYNHPCAKPSNPDMFALPDGGISHSLQANLKKRVDPYLHNSVCAGLDSDKKALHDMGKVWIADMGKKNSRPGCANTRSKNIFGIVNPYHQGPVGRSEKAAVQDSMPVEWKEAVDGAAGVTTSRLTTVQNTGCWVKERKNKTQSKMHAATVDPIAHTGEDPAKPKKGLRMFDGAQAYHSSVHLKHKGGHIHTPRTAEAAINSAVQKKQVHIGGGEFVYNVAGHEDLHPAATSAYTKADRPPSRLHRAENDKRWLPSFYRPNAPQNSQKFEESDDMAYIMGQAPEYATGNFDQMSMTSRPSQEGNVRPRSARQPTRSASARMLPSGSDRGDNLQLTQSRSQGRIITPPTGCTPPRSYGPSEASCEPYDAPRSQGRGSGYSVDSRARYAWTNANPETTGEQWQSENPEWISI